MTASSSSIDGNETGDDGGGVCVMSSVSILFSQGASTNSNTAGNRGGRLFMLVSTLTASSSYIAGITAGDDAGGVCAMSPVSIMFSQKMRVNRNTAVDRGGGLFMLVSTLTASSSSIYQNTAGDDGGGVCATSSSSITLR